MEDDFSEGPSDCDFDLASSEVNSSRFSMDNIDLFLLMFELD
jgi:hypothetical protein